VNIDFVGCSIKFSFLHCHASTFRDLDAKNFELACYNQTLACLVMLRIADLTIMLLFIAENHKVLLISFGKYFESKRIFEQLLPPI